MSLVRFEQVVCRYGATTALAGLNLEVGEGEFLALLGPSGCGKTTALRLLAGFLQPNGGRIVVDGKDMTAVPPERRDIGMVFQEYALFPHMTVLGNVTFGLRERRVRRAEAEARARELLALVHLPDMEDRYPAELSGGQQQRVALARALAFGPRLLLMDEPLGALDLKLREAMQIEIKRVQRALGITTLYVTHDQGEAIGMADRIAVMNGGRIRQLGAPQDIYERPRSRFVAEFLGRANLAEADLVGQDGEGVRLSLQGVPLRAPPGPLPADGPALFAVRPESLRLGPAGPSENQLEARLSQRLFAGNLVKLAVELADGGSWTVEAPPGVSLPPDGGRLLLSWPIERTILLEGD